jgi:hypothetical protein
MIAVGDICQMESVSPLSRLTAIDGDAKPNGEMQACSFLSSCSYMFRSFSTARRSQRRTHLASVSDDEIARTALPQAQCLSVLLQLTDWMDAA